MKNVTKVLVGAGALALSVMTMNAQAADGKALYTEKNCHTCHGADGKAPIMPLYPKLAGQNKEYMVAQMKDIKSGKRANGLSAAMKAMVMNVSDEEFVAIAEYLANVK